MFNSFCLKKGPILSLFFIFSNFLVRLFLLTRFISRLFKWKRTPVVGVEPASLRRYFASWRPFFKRPQGPQSPLSPYMRGTEHSWTCSWIKSPAHLWYDLFVICFGSVSVLFLFFVFCLFVCHLCNLDVMYQTLARERQRKLKNEAQ